MNFVFDRSLPRRTVLRGLGATLALPLLDAMVPAFAVRAKAAIKPAHRFQAFYVPNGMAMEYWTPKGEEGTTLGTSPILEPLMPYRSQMLLLSGIKANWNYIHAGASGSFLTGTVRGGRTEIEIIADVSIDQLMARHFAGETQVPSLAELERGWAEMAKIPAHAQFSKDLEPHIVSGSNRWEILRVVEQ